jgi:2-phospho-L-lactate guanylyltransferase
MRTAAILPVKRFPLAKQRLGESIADSLRLDLARAMVGDVLAALRDCPAIDTTIVVTCEPSVSAAARYLGATVVDDTAEDGQSAAAQLGIARALADRFERVVCVPGDCPTLDPGELTDLLSAGGSGEDVGLQARGPHTRAGGRQASNVVIVPDRHGSGTNGLLLAPPDALSPSFGPDSRARHELLAGEAGASWRIERPPSLLLDIDTGEDLAVLRKRLAGERVRAPRTRAVLGRLETRSGTTDSAETGDSKTDRPGAASDRGSRAA